jgi:CDP-glycerol glycerophosphotransferase (TagB/SpsB family)
MFVQFKNKYNEICRIKRSNLAPFFFLYYIIHKVVEDIFIRIICIFYRVDDHQIILRSFPDYSDNGQALAEYLVDNGYTQKYKVYYDVTDLSKYRNNSIDLKFISCETELGLYRLRWIKVIYTAKYLLFTHRPIIIRKHARKEQVLVNLWHGCGYKDRSNQQGKGRAPYDFSLSPGKLHIKPMAYFWNIEEDRVWPIGYPRYNWLLIKDESAKSLLCSFKRNSDTKVVLWMPTYRSDIKGLYKDSESIVQFPLIGTTDQWYELDNICRKQNIALLIKLHPFQKEYGIPFSSFSNIKEIDDATFNTVNVPMYKFIGLTDALISDYSSVAVDYLIVNRPIAFTLDDYEEYKKTRGFVFEKPLAYMPGHHLYNFEDLKCFLVDVSLGRDDYAKKREEMMKVAISNSDDYCKALLDTVGIESLKTY